MLGYDCQQKHTHKKKDSAEVRSGSSRNSCTCGGQARTRVQVQGRVRGRESACCVAVEMETRNGTNKTTKKSKTRTCCVPWRALSCRWGATGGKNRCHKTRREAAGHGAFLLFPCGSVVWSRWASHADAQAPCAGKQSRMAITIHQNTKPEGQASFSAPEAELRQRGAELRTRRHR